MPFLLAGGAFFVLVNVIVNTFGMHHTPAPKKYVLPKYYTCKGNLKERWFIQWQAENNLTGALEKKRLVCPAKFETKKQRNIWAKEWMDKITNLLESGYGFGEPPTPEPEPAKLLLVPELEKTLNTIKDTLRPKTYITYYSAVNKLSGYLESQNQPDGSLRDLEIQAFRNQDAFLFRDYLINSLKNTARTANNTLIHLNTVYGHLASRVELPPSPFTVKKLKQPDTTKNIAFTSADQKKIEKYLFENEPELYALTRFMYFAFIRPGELNQLRIGDLYINKQNEAYIKVRGEISKTGTTETVDIIKPLMEIIEKIDLSEVRQSYYIFGKELKPSKHLSGKQVAFRRHEKCLKLMNFVDDYTLYSWKHTGVVRAYESGVGIKELQKMLRHASIKTTEIYLKSLGLRTDPNLKKYAW